MCSAEAEEPKTSALGCRDRCRVVDVRRPIPAGSLPEWGNEVGSGRSRGFGDDFEALCE